MVMVSCSSCTDLRVLNSASPLSSTTTTPSSLKIKAPNSFNYHNNDKVGLRVTKWRSLSTTEDNQSNTVTTASPTTTSSDHDDKVDDSASAVVRKFYDGINAHDVDSVQFLIAENCVYEDLVFPRPFLGRKEIIEFFNKFTESTSTDLRFVIDDLSTQDSSSVGVTWHLEWKGKTFPFSRGCSFYRLEVINGKRQITYGRDCVEPALKPGDATLAVIRSVTWLLQRFPQLADRL